MYLEINKYQKGKGNGMNKQIKEETWRETKKQLQQQEARWISAFMLPSIKNKNTEDSVRKCYLAVDSRDSKCWLKWKLSHLLKFKICTFTITLSTLRNTHVYKEAE